MNKKRIKNTTALVTIIAVFMSFLLMPAEVSIAKSPAIGQVKISSASATANSITLKWKKVNNAKGYYVYRKVSPEKSFKKIKTIQKNTTLTFTNTGLKPNTKYSYKLKAYKGKKTGAFSKVKTVTTKKATDIMKQKLSRMEGVVSVEEIEMDKIYDSIYEKYMVTFEQPLDWDHPEKGTFPERVTVGLRKNAKANVFFTNAYAMEAFDIYTDGAAEQMDSLLDANYIQAEQRFFGESCPSDLSHNNTDYWDEYFNLKQSTHDLHHIYTELQKVLGDKWVAYGRSYCGLMTNAYAYYYPDDMDVYLPYCAPCSTGLDDERFYDNIYNTIGSDVEGGDAMRKRITDFQVELMKNKKDLLPLYEDARDERGGIYRSFATPERLFDMNVLELAVQMWQNKSNQESLTAEIFEEVRIKSGDSAEVRNQKLQRQLEILENARDEWHTDASYWPFYVSCFKEIGQYHYNFDYLRKAMSEQGVPETNLSVTKAMEPTFLEDMVLTKKQKETFVYSKDFYNGITADLKTTKAKHLMIFGADDPWRSLRIDGAPDNPNVKEYTLPGGDHNVGIKDFDEATSKEIIDTLNEWLGL